MFAILTGGLIKTFFRFSNIRLDFKKRYLFKEIILLTVKLSAMILLNPYDVNNGDRAKANKITF